MSAEMLEKTCKSEDWFTPESVLEPVRRYFAMSNAGPMDLDPATAPHNPTKAFRFFTKADDGLAQDWDVCRGVRPTNVFVNPPFGKALHNWVLKIGDEAENGHRIVALLPGQRFEQSYWQVNLFTPRLTALVAITKRVSFLGPDGKRWPGSNCYGSFLYLFNGAWGPAVEAFAPIGMVLEVGRVEQQRSS